LSENSFKDFLRSPRLDKNRPYLPATAFVMTKADKKPPFAKIPLALKYFTDGEKKGKNNPIGLFGLVAAKADLH
jgi:hypothetical protein